MLVEGLQMEAVVEEDISLKKTAGKLLIAAWCIEIIAASMGLFFCSFTDASCARWDFC
jgi:hypothetical protein